MSLTVNPDKVHFKHTCKGLFNEIALVLSHKTVVHENAGQLIAYGAAEQSRSNRRIHTARKTENNPFAAYLLF